MSSTAHGGAFSEAYIGWLLNPSIGNLLQQLGAYLRFESTLPKRLSQFAALVTVRHWNNDLEWHFLPAAVLANGTPQHVIDSVAARTRPDFEDESEAVVYDFTSELLNSGHVSDPTYEKAVETLGEDGVFELIAFMGHYSPLLLPDQHVQARPARRSRAVATMTGRRPGRSAIAVPSCSVTRATRQRPAAPSRLGPRDKGDAMPVAEFKVDSYKFVPRNWRAGMESAPMKTDTTVWTGMTTPLPEATVALLTTAGLYLPASQESYDLDRERREPTWGDPTYRVIPRSARQAEMAFAHLHINTRDHYQDFNIALPLDRFAELEAEGRIGRLADEHYSVMGYQSDDGAAWRRDALPAITRRLKQARVDALVLAPA